MSACNLQYPVEVDAVAGHRNMQSARLLGGHGLLFSVLPRLQYPVIKVGQRIDPVPCCFLEISFISQISLASQVVRVFWGHNHRLTGF